MADRRKNPPDACGLQSHAAAFLNGGATLVMSDWKQKAE